MESISKVCMICTGVFDFPVERATFPCPACGTVNGRPMAYDPRKKPQDVTQEYRLRILTRANRQRMRCDFDEAEESYQQALMYHSDEHEALWGRVLCKYHVEYALLQEEDTEHRRMRPVIHRPQSKPIRLDPEFKDACSFAPQDVRSVYEAEAEYIDKLMREILIRAAKSDPYDVYICHKTRRADGMGYTEDYARAQELSRRLTDTGYRVFCEPEPENEDESIAYEAEVFRALETAKVMLVVASQSVYLTDVRVSSQWRRFLNKNEKSDALLDCLLPLLYGDMSVEQLPDDFRLRHLMCIPMETEEAFTRLMREVRRLAGAKSSADSTIEKGTSGSGNTLPETAQPAARDLWTDDGQRRSARSRTGDFAVTMAENGCAVGEYTGSDAVVRIPREIGGVPVTAIADDAFTDNETVRTVIIPEGVRTIGSGAFWHCTGLERVTLPSTLTEIGKWAFSGCAGLAETALPDGLTVIGGSAFSGCRLLRELTLPAGLRRIGHDAFKDCDALRLRVESGSLAHEYVQRWCAGNMQVTGGRPRSDFRTEPCEGGCTLTRYTGRESRVTVPAEVNGAAVVAIGDGAFKGCGTVGEIVLPEGLHSIGDVAFKDCAALTRVKLPEGLLSIGDDAFKGCGALGELVLPQSLTTIGDRAFYGCPSLTLLAAEDSEVRRYASRRGIPFRSLEDVTLEEDFQLADAPGGCEVRRYAGRAVRVVIPARLKGKQVVRIGEEAFRGCGAVTEIVLPEALTEIGDRAFSGCRSLRGMKLSAEIRTIGEDAFEGCGQLSLTVARGSFAHDYAIRCGLDHEAEGGAGSADFSVSAADNGCCIDKYTGGDAHVAVPAEIDGKPVTAIANRAFSGCRDMKSVTLPASVTRLGMWAFAGCTALEKAVLPRGLRRLVSCVFEGCTALTRVTLPAELERIDACAFNACGALRELALPAGVQIIEDAAFCSCPDLTLLVAEGSPAHQCVREKGLRFSLKGGQTVPKAAPEAAPAAPGRTLQANAESDFEVRDAQDGCAIVDYTGEALEVVVPREIGGKPVVQIRPYAFDDCKVQPVSITLPDTIRRLDRWSLANCHQVKEIRLPAQLTALDDCALEGCERLTRIVLPQSLQSIGVCAFHNCEALTELAIPVGVTSIGDYAFMGCSELTLTVQEDSPAHEYAKRNSLPCRTGSMAQAESPAPAAPAVKESPAEDFSVRDAGEGCEIRRYRGSDTEVTVPAQIGGRRVVCIARNAFASCLEVKKIRLPEGVTEIESEAFWECSSLTEILLPPGLQEIGEYAFYSCRRLKELTIPAGVRKLGEKVFEQCPVTLTVAAGSPAHRWAEEHGVPHRTGAAAAVPETPEPRSEAAPAPQTVSAEADFEVSSSSGGCEIDEYKGTSARVTVPSQIGGRPVKKIGAKAFMCDQVDVTHIALPEGMERTGSWAMANCRHLTECRLPSSLHKIDDCAFENCVRLTGLALPQGLTTIGDRAFSGCRALEEMTIPMGVKTIGAYAFAGCEKLTLIVTEGSYAHEYAKKNSLTFRLPGAAPAAAPAPAAQPAGEKKPAGTKDFSVSDAGEGCEISRYRGSDAEVTVPSQIGGRRVVCIARNAFASCLEVEKLRLPEGVTEIESEAFWECTGLKELLLPETLEEIGGYAFYGCRLLKKLTIPAGVKKLDEKALEGCPATLVVTEGSPAHRWAMENGVNFRTDGRKPAPVAPKAEAPAQTEDAGGDYVAHDTDGGCVIDEYRGTSARVVVPARIGGKRVKKIGAKAFMSARADVTQILLPEGMEHTGDWAMANCSHLTECRLPAVLRTIDDSAFENCARLTKLSLPVSLESIGERAFSGCSALMELRIPVSVKAIGPYAFSGCDNLTLVVTEKSYAHEYAKKNGLHFRLRARSAGPEETRPHHTAPQASPENDFVVRRKGGTCTITGYRGKGGRVIVPAMIGGEPVTAIAEHAFEGNGSITEVALPEGVLSIGRAAFRSCTKLIGVKLPQSLTAIDNAAFERCDQLMYLNVPEKVKMGRNVFRFCAKLPESVRKLSPQGLF